MALFSSLVYVSKSSPARLPGPQKLTNSSPSSAQVHQWGAKISGSPLSLNASKSKFHKQHQSYRSDQFSWKRSSSIFLRYVPLFHVSKEINSLIGVWCSVPKPHNSREGKCFIFIENKIRIYFTFWDNQIKSSVSNVELVLANALLDGQKCISFWF